MAEIRGETKKKWGRLVWLPMNPTPPPNQNFVETPLRSDLLTLFPGLLWRCGGTILADVGRWVGMYLL